MVRFFLGMLEIDAGSLAHDDLHCHLLPDWDDGPKSLDVSIEMASRAYVSGIRRILVTPHVGKTFRVNARRSSSEIPAATAELQDRIRARGVDIVLVAGAEVTLTGMEMAERIGSEPWLTVGGRGHYALVETPLHSWPENMERLFFEIGLRGVTPILAHPERIAAIQRDIGIAKAIVARGVVLQVTARSLMNERKAGGASECARSLLDAGLVSILASDAHSPASVLPGQVASILLQRVGAEAARRILFENPKSILEGVAVHPPAAALAKAAKRKGVRGFWGAIAGR